MRFFGSAIAAGAAGSLALCGVAAAQTFNVSCVKGADERTVEILTPGLVGVSCDVQYARASGVKTPYHANNSPGFCREKADEIVAGLITSGFACGQVGGPLTAEARPAPAPVTASLAEPEPTIDPAPEPAPEPALQPNEIAALAETPTEPPAEPVVNKNFALKDAPELAPAETIVAEEIAPSIAPEPIRPDVLAGAAPIEEPFSPPAGPETIGAEPLPPIIDEEVVTDHARAPSPAPSTPTSESIIDEPDTALLSEPAVRSVATQGPATLARDDLEELQHAAEPVATGRLVGAAPSLEPAPRPTTHAAQSRTGAVTEPTPAAIIAATPAQPNSARPAGLRAPEEIIVATLHAQVAAWNEGNLPAFMETYWNDADLKFVSGTAITKGWSPTMKRYRERYADPSGLGQLSFEKTDVEMVTDDVAVVTGRFNHVKNEAASSGVFTLVMKRDKGVWRIVHDHTVSDAS